LRTLGIGISVEAPHSNSLSPFYGERVGVRGKYAGRSGPARDETGDRKHLP